MTHSWFSNFEKLQPCWESGRETSRQIAVISFTSSNREWERDLAEICRGSSSFSLGESEKAPKKLN